LFINERMPANKQFEIWTSTLLRSRRTAQ